MNSKDDQAGSHCSFRDRDEPLTRQPLSADEISVLECMALMEEEDRASFIRMAQGYEVQCVKESDRYRQAGQTTLQRSPPDCTGYWC
ncbi:hypothetical protein CJT41_26925 [Pseudomonas aeruginosa]|nr:hypothetical protein CJT41_26925 [Pseudomonas aeruginosa]